MLEQFISIRFDSTKSALTVSPPDSRTILHVIRSIKSTVADINTFFPFTFQTTLNELKSTSLLNDTDLTKTLQRKRANIELWITPDLRKFLIWTKSDLLDKSQVEEMLEASTNQAERLLVDNVEGLFMGIRELEVLCTLRGEIISALTETDVENGPFEKRLTVILLNEIAKQLTRIMANRVKTIHDLESSARHLITKFTGSQRHRWTNSSQ